MNGQNAGFSDARKLEEIKFNQLISESAIQVNADTGVLERTLAARGLAQSGQRLMAEVDIIFTSIEGVVEKVSRTVKNWVGKSLRYSNRAI
jgi:hypothetical protein